jgi:uncharacterized protein (DUF3084 family)
MTVSLSFDLVSIENHLKEIETTNSFEQVKVWDNFSINSIKNIDDFIFELNKAKNQILELKQEAEKTQGYFKRLSAKSRYAKMYTTNLADIEKYLIMCSATKEKLNYWIQLSPDNQNDLNAMVKELKEKKSLFAIRKKEISINKKQAWADYRNSTVDVCYTHPKLRSMARGNNIHKREEKLNPLDQEIMQIDYDIIEIEKILIWLNRFKK